MSLPPSESGIPRRPETVISPEIPKPLAGKTALITGTTSGIGFDTAIALMEAGCNVIGNNSDPKKFDRHNPLTQKAKELGVAYTPILADISERQGRAKLRFNALGYPGESEGIDFLILNAAGGLEIKSTMQDAKKMNHDAQIGLVRTFLPQIKEGGKVLFMTSTLADAHGKAKELPMYNPVAETKRMAQDSLDSMIPELAEKGITVGTIVAGLVKGTGAEIRLKRVFRKELDRMAARTPGGELVGKDEVAKAVRDACVADFTSGERFYVGGKNQLDMIDPGVFDKVFEKEEVAEILSMYDEETRKVDEVKLLDREHAVGYYKVKDTGIDAAHLTGPMKGFQLHAGHWWDEGAAQAAGILLSQVLLGEPVVTFGGKGAVEYTGMVFPGQVLEYHLTRTSTTMEGIKFDCVFKVGDKVVGSATALNLTPAPSREFAEKEYAKQKKAAGLSEPEGT